MHQSAITTLPATYKPDTSFSFRIQRSPSRNLSKITQQEMVGWDSSAVGFQDSALNPEGWLGSSPRKPRGYPPPTLTHLLCICDHEVMWAD